MTWWSFVASMLNPLAKLSACKFKGKIYIIRGFTARDRDINILWYCPTFDFWTICELSDIHGHRHSLWRNNISGRVLYQTKKWAKVRLLVCSCLFSSVFVQNSALDCRKKHVGIHLIRERVLLFLFGVPGKINNLHLLETTLPSGRW